MTKATARHGNSASIYRVRQPIGHTHVSDGDLRGMIAPFRLACLAGELEAYKRAVDDYWTACYLAADTPAGRVAVLMAERQMRNEPEDWTGK